MSILFKNASIYTEKKLLRNAYLEVVDDKIEGIYESSPIGSFDREIDCKDKLILPSFINSHCHMPMTLLRGFAEGLPLDKWLFDKIFPAELKLTSQLVKVSTKLAIAEQIAGGITSISDMYYFCPDIADVVLKAGVRANICRSLSCFDENIDINNDYRLKEALDFYSEYNNSGDGRVLVDFSFHSEYTTNKSYIQKVLSKLSFDDLRFQIHLSETQKENEDCIKRYKLSPTKYFEKSGLFKHKTTAAHCVHLDKEDIEILSENNVTVASCPVSNLKLGSGIANIPLMVENNINVTLGTDSAASNNNLSMIKEMTFASLLSKGKYNNPCIISEENILEFATINGAVAQGRSDVGCIKNRMKADITVVNLDCPHQLPCYSELSTLIYSSYSSDVFLTMCDGIILYENKEYKTIDIEKLKFEVNNLYKIFNS